MNEPFTSCSYGPMAAIGQGANLPFEELSAAAGFAPALLLLGGDANRRQFLAIALQPAREPQAQRAGIDLVGLALALEDHRRDQERLRPGLHQLAVQHEAEAAGFLHSKHLAP